MCAADDAVLRVEVSGRQIAYRIDGEGPPVVLLHGFFGDHRVWRRQLELADSYTVIAWDAPGCGASFVPPAGYRMSDYADCLAAFIETIGLHRPHVVGNSFGGTLGLALAVQHPSVPRSLLLADTYAGWSGSFSPDVVVDRLRNSLPDLELPVEEGVRKWIPGFVTSSASSGVIDDLSTIISDFDRDGMRVMIHALAEADLREALPRVNVPTRLIWGDQDVRSPLTVAEDLKARIAGSELVVIEGAGHLSHVEAPARFNAEVRAFLGSIG